MSRRLAVVTGVSRGIGRQISRRLVADGFRVAGVFKSSHEEAESLRQELSGALELFQVDLRDRRQTLAFVDRLRSRPVDALINNAGAFELEDFEDFDLTLWDRTFELKLSAPLVLTLGLQKQLGPGASVVNVGSYDGMTGAFASMAYAAANAALINLTKSLGNNLGRRGVRVNAVAPGWIDTEMSTPESLAARELTPLGRNGRPEEVASVVSFLVSAEASFLNGTTVVLDGGYSNVDSIMVREARGTALATANSDR